LWKLTTPSLDNMSREDLVRLALQKKLRQVAQEQYALRLFKPNPGPQEAFLLSPKRLKLLFGGNRTGKSVGGAVHTLWAALGIAPDGRQLKPRSCWVISPTFEVQRDSAQEKVLMYLPTELRGGGKPEPVWRDKGRGYLDRIDIVQM